MKPLAWLFVVLLCGCDDGKQAGRDPKGQGFAHSFWVWHRSRELNGSEVEQLRHSHVADVFWQVAECRWKQGDWKVKRIASSFPPPSGITITPVFRIEPDPSFLGSPDSAVRLADMIRLWHGEGSAIGKIQLDFDCPDALVVRYVDFVTRLREDLKPSSLSITALASWPRHRDFSKLAASVDEFAPMFYDLEPDKPEDVRQGRYQPLAGAIARKYIEAWSGCPKPWFAGLANYERLSLFAENGTLIGHLRDWQHDWLWFDTRLKRGETKDGITVFTPAAALDAPGVRILPGHVLVHRRPPDAETRGWVVAARESGASGVVWFALPGEGMRAAHSVSHLTQADAGHGLSVRVKDGCIVLENTGSADLSPAAWELVIHAGQPDAFRRATPGSFAGWGDTGGVPAEISHTMVLRFSRLSAGASLVSGPVIHRADGLVWKIAGIAEEKPVLPVN